MSEIKKNIETCRGEDVLAEVSGLPQDPHFGSLVNEAFDPMQQQALHQAGYDGYSEVIAQHKPYTFASAIIQMKSNLLLLLRALWQFPFGSGTLRSLSDMWQHYITRLSGNPEHGIPSRLSSLTDLPSAPLLVSDRKISGVPDAVDGMTMVRLLANRTAATLVTEITDDNTGWSYDNVNDVVTTLLNAYPNLGEITIGASYLNKKRLCTGTSRAAKIYLDCEDFDNWDRGDNTHYVGSYSSGVCANLEVYFRKLKRHQESYRNGFGLFRAGKLYFQIIESLSIGLGGTGSYNDIGTYYVYLGCMGVKTDTIMVYYYGNYSGTMDIEIRDGSCQNISISSFTGLTAENMYNHILCRLKQDEAGCGSGVTITLGSTNIAKLEAVEEYNTLLTELEDVYGYTFA